MTVLELLVVAGVVVGLVRLARWLRSKTKAARAATNQSKD